MSKKTRFQFFLVRCSFKIRHGIHWAIRKGFALDDLLAEPAEKIIKKYENLLEEVR